MRLNQWSTEADKIPKYQIPTEADKILKYRIPKLNIQPLEQIESKPLQFKLQEPIEKMAGENDQGEITKIISF